MATKKDMDSSNKERDETMWCYLGHALMTILMTTNILTTWKPICSILQYVTKVPRLLSLAIYCSGMADCKKKAYLHKLATVQSDGATSPDLKPREHR